MLNAHKKIAAVFRLAELPVSVALVVVTVALGGCGRRDPNVVPVTGVVTLDGVLVEGAYVSFLPKTGRPSVGRTQPNGQYALAYTGKVMGALVGLHRVTVTTKQDPDPDTGVKGVPERIPEWYNTKSQLEIEVTRDRKPYDLRLTTAKE